MKPRMQHLPWLNVGRLEFFYIVKLSLTIYPRMEATIVGSFIESVQLSEL